MFFKLLVIVFLVQLWGATINASPEELECEDMKNGSFAERLISWGAKYFKPKNFTVEFFISTQKQRQELLIDFNDDSLEKSGFNSSSKTIFIIHGYLSHGRKKWIIELKDKLLDAMDVNVIIVNWRKGSFKNYINSAKNTLTVAEQIYSFLQGLRPLVEKFNSSETKVEWNNLYFVGHSLGAQISGQAAHILKSKDTFWTVERITGLDPAKPCFILEKDLALKLNKDDAEFVDIVHTQIGTSASSGFGLGESIGHVDFYVNGAVTQPQCEKFTIGSFIELCSHKLAYSYFTDAVIQEINGGCSFLSYSWDGTYDDAQKILSERMKKFYCTDCPHIGLDAPNSLKRGMFIVITSEAEPYCLPDLDPEYSTKLTESFEKLRAATPIHLNDQ